MFYCEECKKKYEWPGSFRFSHGKCECCNKVTDCYDTPSKHLPVPKKKNDSRLQALLDDPNKVALMSEKQDWMIEQGLCTRKDFEKLGVEHLVSAELVIQDLVAMLLEAGMCFATRNMEMEDMTEREGKLLERITPFLKRKQQYSKRK